MPPPPLRNALVSLRKLSPDRPAVARLGIVRDFYNGRGSDSLGLISNYGAFLAHYSVFLLENTSYWPTFRHHCSKWWLLRPFFSLQISPRFVVTVFCNRFLLDYLRWWHVETHQPWRMCTMLTSEPRHVAALPVISHHDEVLLTREEPNCNLPHVFSFIRPTDVAKHYSGHYRSISSNVFQYGPISCEGSGDAIRIESIVPHGGGRSEAACVNAMNITHSERFIEESASACEPIPFIKKDAATFSANLHAIESGVAVKRPHGASRRCGGMPSVHSATDKRRPAPLSSNHFYDIPHPVPHPILHLILHLILRLVPTELCSDCTGDPTDVAAMGGTPAALLKHFAHFSCRENVGPNLVSMAM